MAKVGRTWATYSDDQKKRIGHALRTWRKQQQPVLLQLDVAARLGVEQATISKVEQGRGCSGELAQAIARMMGISVYELIEDPKSRRGEDQYEQRGLAVECARVLGISEATIKRVQRAVVDDGQPIPSALWWMRRLLDLDEEAQKPRVRDL